MPSMDTWVHATHGPTGPHNEDQPFTGCALGALCANRHS